MRETRQNLSCTEVQNEYSHEGPCIRFAALRLTYFGARYPVFSIPPAERKMSALAISSQIIPNLARRPRFLCPVAPSSLTSAVGQFEVPRSHHSSPSPQPLFFLLIADI